MLDPVLTLTIFFLLSLSGAYVLFKVLKSTALVRRRGYQAGGALAGFLIILTTLTLSHYKLLDVKHLKEELGGSNDEVKKQQLYIEELELSLRASEEKGKSQHWEIRGSVRPAAGTNDDILVSLSPAFEDKTDSGGNFSLWAVKLSSDQEENISLNFGEYCCSQPINVETANYDREKLIIELKESVSIDPPDSSNDSIAAVEIIDENEATDHEGEA